MMRVAVWLVAGVVLGVIIHLSAIFVLPQVAPASAGLRLAAVTSVNQMAVLDNPVAIMPTSDPAFQIAVCRYDLTAGVLRVRTAVTNHYTAVAFYDATGRAYGSINDRSANRRRDIDFYIANADQKRRINAQEDEAVADALVIVSPTQTGFVMVRALSPQAGDAPLVRDTLRREARCMAVPVDAVGEH